MNAEERARLITRYRDGHNEVVQAFAGITESELDHSAVPGEWTPRQIAHHLGDSEMMSAIRIRRLLTEFVDTEVSIGMKGGDPVDGTRNIQERSPTPRLFASSMTSPASIRR